MEDLFEIVSSYIPEEQKDDIKSKIDGKIGEIVKERSTETKRELSKKLGINLFEEDVDKVFSESKFVKKDAYTQLEQTYKAKETELTELQSKVKTYEEETAFSKIGIKLIKEGFNPERLEIAKPLFKDIQGDTEEEKIANFKTKLPEFFGKVKKNPYEKDDEGKGGLTEAERYFEQIRQQNK